MADKLSPDQALQRLLEGNKRYVVGNLLRPHQSPARRIEVAEGQHPFASILGCSDSRVPPELIFDQGLGDLFVVRVAGHVADAAVVASLIYGVEHLGIPLIVVLGHKNCGAVHAAVEGNQEDALSPLVRAIQPALNKVKLQPSALLDNAVRAHAELTTRHLRAIEPLSRAVKEGRVAIYGAYYDISDGSVTLLD